MNYLALSLSRKISKFLRDKINFDYFLENYSYRKNGIALLLLNEIENICIWMLGVFEINKIDIIQKEKEFKRI